MTTIKDIAKLLVAQHKVKIDEAENFVTMFVEVINEGLLTDRQVKIKGLGTFKLQTVKERSSVSVSTGERVTIGEHDKITFTPDVVMRDLVNKPFAQFETVIIDDETILDDIVYEGNYQGATLEDIEKQELTEENNIKVAMETKEKTENASIVTGRNIEDVTNKVQEEVHTEITSKPRIITPLMYLKGEDQMTVVENTAEETLEEVGTTVISEVTEMTEDETKPEDDNREIEKVENDTVDTEIQKDVEESVEDEQLENEETIEKVSEEDAQDEIVSDTEEENENNGTVEESNTNNEMETENTKEEDGSSENVENTEDKEQESDDLEEKDKEEDEEDDDDYDDEPEYYENDHSPMYYYLVGGLIGAVLFSLIGYYAGRNGWFSGKNTQNVEQVDSTVVSNENTVVTSSAEADSVNENIETSNEEQSQRVDEKEDKSDSKSSKISMDEYNKKDIRVRTGAWKIIGTKCEVTVKKGQTLKSISKAQLGPDMECYVEVYNDKKTVKAGDVLKIPKLAHK
jgi:nucleoid DNA-binding protein